MEHKRVQSLVIRLNDKTNLIVQENKLKAFLAKESEKFSQLINKFKRIEKR